MVGYNDPYNASLTRESNARARQHGMNIDRLNGSGKTAPKNEKMTGGMMCPMDINPVTDPETGKTYHNRCKMAAAKRGPEPLGIFGMGSAGSRCCARCKCGSGMSGGGSDTPIPAREWFKAEDQSFKRAIAQTITPKEVAANRASKDLGAGKYAKGGNMALRNVTPTGITPTNVALVRMNKDLGAGKCEGGVSTRSGRVFTAQPVARKKTRPSRRECCFPAQMCRGTTKYNMRGGAKEDEEEDSDSDEDYDEDDDCGEMEGGGEGEEEEEPETLREMKSICDDYEQKKLTGGAMTKAIRAMLPRGKKTMSVALSKALQKLKKRGRASYARRVNLGLNVLPTKKNSETMQGSGRYVGGAKDHPDIERIHDSVFGGSKLTGGYGPVATTTEALAGYDNRNQPQGLMPPPSVNQQRGLRGGALPLRQGYPAEPQPTQQSKGRPRNVNRGGYAGIQTMEQGGKSLQELIPENQLPSRIGGGKGKATGGSMPSYGPGSLENFKKNANKPEHFELYSNGSGRFAPDGDYIGPSTGAIIPELQSEVSPAGSGKGKRGARGAMVAKLMREKGMSLGEASRALKGGAYTANDFFMPRNIHQFFGAYA